MEIIGDLILILSVIFAATIIEHASRCQAKVKPKSNKSQKEEKPKPNRDSDDL